MSLVLTAAQSPDLHAGEEIFSHVKTAETLPEGAWEAYQTLTSRFDKGQGSYNAWNLMLELEYGVTDKLSISGGLQAQSLDTSGLIVDGYIPEEIDRTGFSGAEIGLKYNFLQPAKAKIGLTYYTGFDFTWVDPHSGQDKYTLSYENQLLLQKYMMEGQLIWATNLGVETTYADRASIPGLSPDIEWPTDPEVEIELQAGTALSYRIAPKLFVNMETLFETEFETEVGQERWSVFVGPSLHYATEKWWATIGWLPQVGGGGERYPGQTSGLHLIEKTAHEIRFRAGLNF
ncbi:MAG: hypothetical protein KDN19_01550 [Verrucomicrobiae bacterium]|nr:hypothetical protein [Verrucomicrobiae bacterium]